MTTTARDDYPEAAGPTLGAYVRQHAAMCDEIDALRHDHAIDAKTIKQLTYLLQDCSERLAVRSKMGDRSWVE